MKNEIKSYSNKQAREIIENEGLEYAVTGYIDSQYFKDDKTENLWLAAELAIKELREHLGVDEEY